MKGYKLPDKGKEMEFMKYAAQKVIRKALIVDWMRWPELYQNDGASEEQSVRLAKAAAVLENLVNLLKADVCYRKNIAFKAFNEELREANLSYLPSNPRRLEEKCMLGLHGVPIKEIVKIPRRGNQNARGNRSRVKLSNDNYLTRKREWEQCPKRDKMSDRNYITDPIT